MNNDIKLGFSIGAAVIMLVFMVLMTAIDNPTLKGNWKCTDWQIVNYKPECHVMTKIGDK